MSQTELLLLAKQGNVEAIATLMNRKLQPAGIALEASLDRNCLVLNLTGDRLPDRAALTAFVRKGMGILKVESLKTVQVSGWQQGASVPAWTETLRLDDDAPEPSSPPPPAYPPAAPPVPPPAAAPASAPAAPPASPPAPDYGPDYGSDYGSDYSAAYAGDRPAGAYASDFDGSALDATAAIAPETEYEAWIRQTERLGPRYNVHIPRLAEYLVFFLLPQETPLDLAGVRYQGKLGVLLLSDRRLACLTLSVLPPVVREAFAEPLANFGRAGVAETGLRLSGRGGDRLLYFDNPATGQAFAFESLREAVPVAPGETLPAPKTDDSRLKVYGLGGLAALYAVVVLLHLAFGR